MTTLINNQVATNKISPDPENSLSGENDGKSNKGVSEQSDLDNLIETTPTDDQYDCDDTRESESANIDSSDNLVNESVPIKVNTGAGSLRDTLHKSHSLIQKLDQRKAKRAEREKNADV